jgi:hypothetical protein
MHVSMFSIHFHFLPIVSNPKQVFAHLPVLCHAPIHNFSVILGVPFERAIRYHRWIGRAVQRHTATYSDADTEIER